LKQETKPLLGVPQGVVFELLATLTLKKLSFGKTLSPMDRQRPDEWLHNG